MWLRIGVYGTDGHSGGGSGKEAGDEEELSKAATGSDQPLRGELKRLGYCMYEQT